MSPREQWRDVCAQPLAFVRRDAIGACFGEALSDQQLDALLESSRYQARLETLLKDHFLLPDLPAVQDDADLPVLLLSTDNLPRLALLCGATWHAKALSREIRGAVVQTLKERLGAEVFTFALAHRSHAGAADFLVETESLLEAIERDGKACVRAWLQALPDELQAWMGLRLEATWMASAERSPQAVALVRHVAVEAFPA